MTKTKKLRVLREIYASIPDAGCKGLCADKCTTAPMFPIELEQLEAAAGRKLPTMPAGDEVGGVLLGHEIGTPCPMLVLGRCTAYEHRPLICRTFGSVEGMRCEHGCGPAKPLGNVSHLFDKIASL